MPYNSLMTLYVCISYHMKGYKHHYSVTLIFWVHSLHAATSVSSDIKLAPVSFSYLFLIHLSLAESSGAYEMKIHLVWFADFSYRFVSTFKKVFFRSWPRSIDVSIWWSRMQQCKQYHVSLFWANMSINTSLG